MADEFDFGDLEPQEKPFQYRGRKFVALEADAAAYGKWETARTAAWERRDDGTVKGYGTLPETEVVLVAFSIREIVDGERVPVALGEVRGWQAKVVDRLFRWIRSVSEFPTPETPADPKSSAGGPATSGSATN